MLDQWRLAQADYLSDDNLSDDVALERYLGTALKLGVFHAVQHHQHEVCSAAFRGTRLVYVQIYKVNTYGVCANIMAMDDGGVTSRSFEFTFVREPLGRFSSGFSEISYRSARYHGADSRGSETCAHWKDHSTTSRARARVFLEELLAGRLGQQVSTASGAPHLGHHSGKQCALYERLLHVLPQVGFVVAALARHDVESLGYIGKLETLESDWEELGSHVTMSALPEGLHGDGAWPRFRSDLWAVPWGPGLTVNPHAHTNADSGSSAREQMDSLISEIGGSARLSLCRVFLPDFVCFGYPLPDDCAAAIGTQHGVTCPYPWALP